MKMTLRLTTAIAALAVTASAQITTGWQSPLTTTTYTWSDTANWVDGEINGIFSNGLVGSGKTYPTIVFTADETLPGGLVLAYTNAEQNLTFRGSGGDRTLTLGGPISMNLHKATKGSVKIGSATAGEGLSLLFAGSPVFDIGYGPWMELFQPVSGGDTDALVTGSSDTASILALHGDQATLPGAVSVTQNKGLYFNSNDKNAQGTIRATSVRLDRADLVVQGNTGAASVDRISGTLTLAGGGMSQFIHYHNANFKNHTLRVGSLVMEPGAILDIHSPSLVLGTTEFESGNNFIVDAGVATVGTGAAGTVTAPIVPWARASNNNSTDNNLFGHLVSYDATRGFRILDRATEQDQYEAGYVGPVTNQGANVYASAGASQIVEFTGNNTVNSLQFSTSGKSGTLRANDGLLTISSGAIEMTGTDNITINANIDVGGAPAYITYRGDKTGSLKGSLAGTGGVTFQSQNQTGAGNAGITVDSTGSYTGATYINSWLAIATSSFLPGGERLGDIYLNNILFIDGGTYNGLYGEGNLRRLNSGNGTISFGDNDADGDFTGTLSQNKGKFTIRKIGAGTQRFACSSMVGLNGLAADAGTLILDGTLSESSVTVANGAAFGGGGTVTAGGVSFAEGSTFAVSITDNAAPYLTVAGEVTGSASVEVSVTGRVRDNFSACILRSDSAISATFTCATKGYRLEWREEGTELWLSKKPTATFIMVQ